MDGVGVVAPIGRGTVGPLRGHRTEDGAGELREPVWHFSVSHLRARRLGR